MRLHRPTRSEIRAFGGTLTATSAAALIGMAVADAGETDLPGWWFVVAWIGLATGFTIFVASFLGRGRGGAVGAAPALPTPPPTPGGFIIHADQVTILQLVVNSPGGVREDEVDEDDAVDLLRAGLVELREGRVYPTRQGRRYLRKLGGEIRPTGEVSLHMIPRSRLRVSVLPVGRSFRVGVQDRIGVHLAVDYEGPSNTLTAQVTEVVSASGGDINLPIPWSIKWADSSTERVEVMSGQRRVLEFAEADLMGGPMPTWLEPRLSERLGTFWFQRPSAAPYGISLGSGIERTTDLYTRRLRVAVTVSALDPRDPVTVRLRMGFRQEGAEVYPVVEEDAP